MKSTTALLAVLAAAAGSAISSGRRSGSPALKQMKRIPEGRIREALERAGFKVYGRTPNLRAYKGIARAMANPQSPLGRKYTQALQRVPLELRVFFYRREYRSALNPSRVSGLSNMVEDGELVVLVQPDLGERALNDPVNHTSPMTPFALIHRIFDGVISTPGTIFGNSITDASLEGEPHSDDYISVAHEFARERAEGDIDSSHLYDQHEDHESDEFYKELDQLYEGYVDETVERVRSVVDSFCDLGQLRNELYSLVYELLQDRDEDVFLDEVSPQTAASLSALTGQYRDHEEAIKALLSVGCIDTAAARRGRLADASQVAADAFAVYCMSYNHDKKAGRIPFPPADIFNDSVPPAEVAKQWARTKKRGNRSPKALAEYARNIAAVRELNEMSDSAVEDYCSNVQSSLEGLCDAAIEAARLMRVVEV